MTEELAEIKEAILKKEDLPKAVSNLRKFGDFVLSELDKNIAEMEANRIQEKSLFLQLFGDHQKARILDFFLKNPDRTFSKDAIVKGAKMNRSPFFQQNQKRYGKKYHYNHFGDLLRLGVIKAVDGGNYPKYALNKDHKVAQTLLDLELALIEEAMEKAKMQKQESNGE